jgi:hypothetical protein
MTPDLKRAEHHFASDLYRGGTGMNERDYSAPAKLRWYPDISCPVCGGRVNSWDKRCSRALGYKAIVCEACISKEYGIDVEELRDTMKNHFGLIPCPGI